MVWCAGGHVHVLAWAASAKMLGNEHAPAGYYYALSSAMEAACKHGRINVILWLLKYGCRWKGDLFDCAKKGNLPFLQWVHSNAALLASKMDPAANRGLFWDPAMPADKYMAGPQRGGTCTSCSGPVDTLKPQGPHLLRMAFAAAEYGHLDILKWARSRGSFGSAQLCSKAATGGHLDCLQWAHENGYPLHNKHLRLAAAARWRQVPADAAVAAAAGVHSGMGGRTFKQPGQAVWTSSNGRTSRACPSPCIEDRL